MKHALVLLLLSCWLVALANQRQQSFPPPGKLIDIGGYRLHLNCTGNQGPTVVLIAGAGDFSFDWSLVQPNVAKFARVCSYDRAGFAWSDPGPTPRTMKQEAFELHTMLKAAQVNGPYVLVGHSIGGLTARVYASEYPREVAGIVLIDSLHEDTTVGYQGKLVHLRELAKDAVPPVQTIKSSALKPIAQADLDQFDANLKLRPPKISAPYDKLPPAVQQTRLWALSQPPRAAPVVGLNFLPEEMRDLYEARAKTPYQLGSLPLVIILQKEYLQPPSGVDAEEWRRLAEPKQQQKIGLTSLSHNSKLILAEKSGHHIHLDAPEVVVDAVRLVVESLRRHQTLAGQNSEKGG